MPQTHGRKIRRQPAGLALLTAALLIAALAGCDAIYDDTKGWGKRLEASILEAAHDVGKPKTEAPAEAGDGKTAAAEGSREVPLPPPAKPIEVAALADNAQPPLAPSPSEAGEAAASGGARPEGAMAAASESLLPSREPEEADPKAAAAARAAAAAEVPQPPKPKPEAQAASEKSKAPTSETKSAADAAVAMVLHLSSLRSEAAAKREWGELQHHFPDSLGHMQAEFRRTDLGDKGTFYRVLAGPLPSRQDAKQACAAVKAKDAKQYCHVMPQKPKA